MKKGQFYSYPDRFKGTISFSSVVKPIVSEDKDKYLALASTDNLKKFLPDIDIARNYDLLCFAGNAFIANRLNSNDDGISTKEAIVLAKLFPFRYCNLEHDRSKVLGVILTASYSEFGTDKPLTEEQIKDYTKPFNVTVGGIIWRVINEGFADAVEDSMDPTSELFGKCSLSWEVSLEDIDLVVLEKGKKNFEDGKIISDASEISKLESRLKAFGGQGITDDGKRIGRIAKGEVLPLGVGFVEHPAAEVKPIVIKTEEEIKASEINKSEDKNKNIEKNDISISHSEKTTVNKQDKNIMKISNIKDINDDNLKEAKASEVISVIDNAINQISIEWQEKNKLVEKNRAEVESKYKELEASNTKMTEAHSKLQEDLKKIQDQYTLLIKANEARELEDKYSARMEALDDEFELEKDERELVASEIKTLNDEDYKAYAKKMDMFWKNKKKQKGDKGKEVKEEKKEVKASLENPEDVLDKAIEAGEKDKVKPATTTTATESIAVKAAKCFSIENWVPSQRKR